MGADVDMGADEFLGPCQTCLGDLADGNSLVNMADYNQLQADLIDAYDLTGQYLITTNDTNVAFLWKACSDMDEDDDIDFSDYILLQGNIAYADCLYGDYEYECGDPNLPACSTSHVESIVCETVGTGQKKGRATITIYDDCDKPLIYATVTGTFTGDYDEEQSGVTDSAGVAVIDTDGTAAGQVSFTFCVDDVNHLCLTYDPNDNIETCDTN